MTAGKFLSCDVGSVVLRTAYVHVHPLRGHAMSSSSLKVAPGSTLNPATELARASGMRFPNESAEYRRAREALLAEEIELRQQRARRRTAASIAAGRRGEEELCLRGRERKGILR